MSLFQRGLCEPLKLYHRNSYIFSIFCVYMYVCICFPGNPLKNARHLKAFVKYLLTDQWTSSRLLLSLCSLINRRGIIMPILLGSFKRQKCGRKLRTSGNCPTENLRSSLLSSLRQKVQTYKPSFSSQVKTAVGEKAQEEAVPLRSGTIALLRSAELSSHPSV